MSEHKFHFDIAMSCGGCSGAIERVLKKTEGVKSYDVSLEKQSADVTADESLEYETLLEKLKKTGKTVKSGAMDGQSMSV